MRTNGNYSSENREMINSSISNFFKPVHVPHKQRDGFETVEQFLARGGKIEQLAPGDSSETARQIAIEERRKQWGSGKLVNPK